MECKEGLFFTQENLAAFCNVGRSSKTGVQGHIGEKGTGIQVGVHGGVESSHQSREISRSISSTKWATQEWE